MTTTTNPHMEAQNPTQNPAQEQAQAQVNPAVDGPSPALPTVPTTTPPPPADTDATAAKARKKQRNEALRALSQTFGGIPNVEIFAEWEYRKACCDAAVHRSIMAGIVGNGEHGAYSIALSSLYKDDQDGGDVIIYTGAGGRERWSKSVPPRRLRLGPQTKDQSWDHPSNKALIVSFVTGNPVRVVRSWRCPSQYAPLKGYRYDGLYKVAAYWSAKGRNGKNICRCRLERLPDQPPIPLRPLTFSASKRRRREHLVSESHITRSPSPSINSCDTSGTSYIRLDQPNSSSTLITGSESEGLSSLPEQQGMSVGSNFHDEVDSDVKEDTQSLPPQRRTTPSIDALPRYRWDSKQQRLIQVHTSHPDPEPVDLVTTEGHEGAHRGEDDALTLVQSEDGDVDTMTERTETEYFSDRGESP